MNPGEIIVLPVVLLNTGLSTSQPTAVLKAFSQGVTLLDGEADFPDIQHNEKQGSLPPHFSIQTDLSMEDGQEILFEVNWAAGQASGKTHFTEKIKAADLAFVSSSVDDSAFDNDGVVDPGETVSVVVEITNQGSIDAQDVWAQMECSHPQYITLDDPLAEIGPIAAGGTAQTQAPHFTLTASPSTPNYLDVEFTLTLTGSNFKGQVSFPLEITYCDLEYVWLFDEDPGWTCEEKWAFGIPTGKYTGFGCPDPSAGYTGTQVYGYNLNGGYTGSGIKVYCLTSEAIDCTGCQEVKVRFMRWLGVASCDGAAFKVSNDGVHWTNIWSHSGGQPLCDGAWVEVEYDLSGVADNQPTVYLRWTMGPFGSYKPYCGWNIDDVELWCK
jgi:hypothetical protein